MTDRDLEERVHHVLGFISARAGEEGEASDVFSVPVIAATSAWLMALQFAIDAPEEWAQMMRVREAELAGGVKRISSRFVAWVVGRGDAGDLGAYLSIAMAGADLAEDG